MYRSKNETMKLPYTLVQAMPRVDTTTFSPEAEHSTRSKSRPSPQGSLDSIAAIALENDSSTWSNGGRRWCLQHLECSRHGKTDGHIRVRTAWICPSFPKGASGLCPAKTLHDDGNRALGLGVWTGFTDCHRGGKAVLRFVFCDLIVSCPVLAEKQLVPFHGWIPHITKHEGEPFNDGELFQDNGEDRYHASSFLNRHKSLLH